MIVLNAWCFDAAHRFVPERARALFNAYNSKRRISDEEKEVMVILAREAAMRFVMTRCFDWLNRTQDALVNVKDPKEYLLKLRFHKENDWMELL